MKTPKPSHPLRILLVEDNAHDHLAFSRAFQQSGLPHEITCYVRAEEALQRLREDAGSFDLVVGDYKLPGMTGLELFLALRGNSIPLPMVILTGSGSEQLAVEALKAGVNDYLIKDPCEGYLELLPVVLPKVVQKHGDRMARHHAEDALRESEQKLRAIVDGFPIPHFIIDRNHEVIYWNKALEEFTGVKRDAVLGTDTHWKAFYPEKRACMVDLLIDGDIDNLPGVFSGTNRSVKLLPDSYSARDYFPFMGNEGKWLYFTAALIRDSKGAVIGAMETLEDLSGQKKMEEELLKAQKLESLGRLAGGIAHDFNNALTGIMGNISLAILLASPGDKIFARLAEAERSSLRAKELTNRLVTFAQGGAPVRTPLSLATRIKDWIGLALSGSKALCVFSLPDDLWTVDADEGQLGQAINNIVINADQAMPDGGKITIECANVEIPEEEEQLQVPGKYVRIRITDQGRGIPEEVIGKIFDPYFTTKDKGQGLGLALAYSIIKNHSGQIAVESRPESGATFIIHLPATATQLPEPAKVANAEQGSGKGKVLVMDDEEIVRLVLGEMLEYLGCTVGFATNGLEAIELYTHALQSESPFDAVIMDLTIPGGMGGKEAILQLRKIDPNIKAIVSSGYSNDPVMAEYQKYGFVGVAAKPYRIDELSEQLGKVLR